MLQGSKLKKKRWMTLKQCNDQNCEAYRKSKNSGNNVGKIKSTAPIAGPTKIIRNQINVLIRKYEFREQGLKKTLHKILNKKPKKFYSYVRSKNKSKEGIGPLPNNKEHLVKSDCEMVQILNTFFASVFTT